MLTAAEVETGTGGTLACGAREAVFTGVSIDTRTLQQGNVFFAILGPNHDGHKFIPEAVRKGAQGVVAQRDYEYPGKFPAVLIRVEDTHRALKDLARWVRHRWLGTLVAVTGSMGKTTTRTFAAQVLGSTFRVYQTPGNYNNLFGLPLALFGLCPEHEFGIFEMGMSALGEIAEMCRIASPTVGILTNVAPVHLAFFNSISEIAQAKGELARSLPPDGLLVYNGDDPLVCEIARDYTGEKLSFGFSTLVDVRATRIEIAGPDKTTFDLVYEGTSAEASIPFAGAHYVMNALAAAALGARYRVPRERVVESLARLQQPAMRGRMLRFADGFSVIDDSYNSNPEALKTMIDVLSSIPSHRRRILVAGEMLELGRHSDTYHFECGAHAARRGIHVLIGVQGAAREMVRGAVESGMAEQQVKYFDNAEEAAAYIMRILQEGDLVLFKGSRGVHLERVIQHLQSHFGLLN